MPFLIPKTQLSVHEGIVLSDLWVKEIDKECSIFYTVKNGYYFVYPRFIRNVLLWSKHPKAFGTEGYLGNHISIHKRIIQN
jgi:hypothetical protein